MAKAFPGISTSEVRKKFRYMLPPSKTDPKDTPKYTWAFTNLSEKEKQCKYFVRLGHYHSYSTMGEGRDAFLDLLISHSSFTLSQSSLSHHILFTFSFKCEIRHFPVVVVKWFAKKGTSLLYLLLINGTLYLLLINGTPFEYLVQRFLSLLTAVNDFFTAVKFIRWPFWVFLQTEMTDSSTL